MPKMRIIAISGPHGAGKSSVAKRLAQELDMTYVSAGDVFRALAKERNISLKEFSELVIKEPQIDQQIDERTKELGSKDNTIVDAQLAAFFTPSDIPLRIYITASPEVRYQRIAKREGKSLEYAKTETIIRETAERKRFMDLYKIDVDDYSHYDVIINTDRLSIEQTYQICKSLILSVFEN